MFFEIYFLSLIRFFIRRVSTFFYSQNTRVVIRDRNPSRGATWTGTGYMQATEGATLEFVVDDVPFSTEYNLLIRYEATGRRDWKEVGIEIVRPQSEDPSGPCGNMIQQQGFMMATLSAGATQQLIFPAVCLERGQRYVVKFDFTRQGDVPGAGPQPTILIDSVCGIKN